MRALRLIAVILAMLAASAAPTAAGGASNVSIFYYPWYGTPAFDGGWAHWLARTVRLGHRFQLLPGPRPLLELESACRLGQMHEIAGAGSAR